MCRRIVFVALFLTLVSPAIAPAQEATPHNFIIIIADDVGVDKIGATYLIEELAAQAAGSVVFDGARRPPPLGNCKYHAGASSSRIDLA